MMNFKNIFGILAISAVSMMTVSCSEDIMDRINTDQAHPGESVVSAKFQLTDAIVSSVSLPTRVTSPGMLLLIQSKFWVQVTTSLRMQSSAASMRLLLLLLSIMSGTVLILTSTTFSR